MISAVIIRCQTPSGSYRFHAPTCSETPAQPYEEKALRRGLRAGVNVRAQFNSPGRTSALSRRPSFSRRQAVGVVAYLNTSTLTAVINFCGSLSRWSSFPRFQFCQEPKRGFTDRLKVLSCALFVHDKQRSEKGMSWAASVVSRVTKCL